MSTTAEAGAREVIEAEDLATERTNRPSQIERWVEGDPDRALKRIETMTKMLETLRVHSIRATYPSDWIVHTTLDGEGNVVSQRCYLQDIGADRAGKLWGIEVERPSLSREDFPDGTFAYHLFADAYCKATSERIANVEGSRWSGDGFFQPKREGERLDPTDVSKAAYANLHGRAVRALAGLNGVPLEMLKQAGLDTSRCVFVGYGKGAKGGQSTGAVVGGVEATIRWGNSKGKKVSEISDRDLEYYIRAEEKNLTDPAKERYRKSTQAMLDSLNAERERRTKAAEQAEETGTAASQTRGAKLVALKGRVEAALGKGKLGLTGELLHALGTSAETLSKLSDEELDKLAELPSEELQGAADAIKEGAK